MLAWAIYGLLRADGPVIAANLITLVPASVVLERKLRALLEGRDRRGPGGKG